MLSLLLLLACGDDSTTDSATDDTGTPATDDTGTDTTTVTDNTAPTCAITSPEDGTFGEQGDVATFLGTAADDEQSAASLTATWSSDKDGDLGTTAPTSGGDVVLTTDGLSSATHVITLSITDDGDELCSDFVLFSVGEPPVATITGPGDDRTYDEGESIGFQGQVSDDATDAVDLLVIWDSDLDGGLDSDSPDSSGALGFSDATLSAGLHTVTLTVTDADGLYAVDTLPLTVNGLPSAPGVSLTPADPDTTDDLVVSVDSASVDPEGADVTYTVAWSLYGTVSSASTDSHLPAEATSRGEVWTVSVTPFDGDSSGPAGEQTVTIANAAPSMTGASISPNPATAEDTLTCTGSGFSDADGDSDASTFAWTVDGTVIGTASTQTGGFGGDDSVVCEITPHDGTDAGTPVTAVVTLGNTAPSITVVSISPDPATVSDTLTCAWSGFVDPDGDSDESLASWTVDGSGAGSGTTLSSGFAGTDTVTCTVTPYDGASTGTAVDASLTVTNAVPSLTGATITPSPAVVGDTLLCTAAGWSDADGHADQSTWSWTVNGTEVSTAASLASDFVGGDTVACTVTPYDGTDTGAAVDDSLVVANSAPSVSSVTIDPDPATSGDSLTCSWTFDDPDGDADWSTVLWKLNGTTAGTDATLTTTLVRDDVVSCTVTPADDSDTGTALTTSLLVSNSAPSVSSVTITPSSPTADSTLSCAWSGFVDEDGDSDVSSVAWTVNGSTAGTGTSLASGFVGDDIVVCAVTPSDGTDAGTPVSDTVTVDNTPPETASATVTPSAPNAGDTLTCNPGTTTDADGTTLFTYSYAWTVDGSAASGTSSTLAGAFVRDDPVTCTVTPHDGDEDGDSVTSAAVTVVNAVPVIDDLSLSDSAPATDDTLSVTVSTSDLDGDSVSVTYTWTVDGSEVSGASGSTLDGDDHFDKGQTVTVTAVPDDGTDDGDASTSETATVDNTAPTAPTVEITPDDPAEGIDDLVCGLTGESTDADGDAVTYSAAWTVDGSPWIGGAATSAWSDDTISGADTLEDEVWECTMTPDDGDDDGDTATDSVTIVAGTCEADITSVDYPTYIASSGTTQGAWFSDPLETLGAGLIWWINDHSGSSTVYEYSSMANFQSNSSSRTISLPYTIDGTGSIAYDGYLYFNRAGTADMVKVDLSDGSLIASQTLSGAGNQNDCHWQWGGYSDIDFELDEQGLWVIYGDESSSCNITVAKLDTDLNVEATYTTSAGDRRGYGNAWMTDGILYVTANYSSSTSTISYAYNTCDGTSWSPGLTFYNAYGYNSQITYNPAEQVLYSWDSGVQVQYTVNF